MLGTPAVGGGLVFVDGVQVGRPGRLCCKQRAPKWSFDEGAIGSPAYDYGKVFVTTGSGVTAVTATTGANQWTFALTPTLPSSIDSPAVANGLVYDDYDGYPIALIESTGALIWQPPCSSRVRRHRWWSTGRCSSAPVTPRCTSTAHEPVTGDPVSDTGVGSLQTDPGAWHRLLRRCYGRCCGCAGRRSPGRTALDLDQPVVVRAVGGPDRVVVSSSFEVVQPAPAHEVLRDGCVGFFRPGDVGLGVGWVYPLAGESRLKPASRCGTAVAVGATRVTAPWKCSNRISDIGEGTERSARRRCRSARPGARS